MTDKNFPVKAPLQGPVAPHIPQSGDARTVPAQNYYGALTHTVHRDGVGWAVLCVAMLFFHVHRLDVRMYEKADDDDNDARMLSEYQKRAHAY